MKVLTMKVVLTLLVVGVLLGGGAPATTGAGSVQAEVGVTLDQLCGPVVLGSVCPRPQGIWFLKCASRT